VLEVAPSIVEGSKKLWSKVAQPEPAVANPAQSAKGPEPTGPDAIAALDVRLGTLEKKVAGLKEESKSSFEVVRSLTEQHSQLVHAVDVLIARTRVLLRVCILLAVALVALFVLAVLR